MRGSQVRFLPRSPILCFHVTLIFLASCRNKKKGPNSRLSGGYDYEGDVSRRRVQSVSNKMLATSISSNSSQLNPVIRPEHFQNHAILGPKMTIKTKSMMRRRVNRAGPSGLV